MKMGIFDKFKKKANVAIVEEIKDTSVGSEVQIFSEFLEFFDLECKYKQVDDPYLSLIANFGGRDFGNGLFRIFKMENIQQWETNVTEVYPQFTKKFKLFAYDWLGRCFGIDLRSGTEGKVLMFEVGTNEVLEISCDLLEFLNEEIPLDTDACLACNFFEEWTEFAGKPLEYERCAGYKVPLFLGGEDKIENLEDSDMEVYWHIIYQAKKNL